MSQRESTLRCHLIISKLRKGPADYNDMAGYLRTESGFRGYNLIVSKRTFQRDIEDIKSIYDIDIRFDFSRKVYTIEKDWNPELNERMIDALETFNALRLEENLSGYFHLEPRRPQGTGHLSVLINAIRNRLIINFKYSRFDNDKTTSRRAEPYLLKEFRDRWYVLAKDLSDDLLKAFGLDRIADLVLSDKKFIYPPDFDKEAYYKNCFGVIKPEDGEPAEVILSFDPLQGMYVKSLPLHVSQKVIKDDENELIISLRLYITFDLVMELLSFGSNVKVIEPSRLAEELKQSYRKALKNY